MRKLRNIIEKRYLINRVDSFMKRVYVLCSDRLITWAYSLIDCIYGIQAYIILIYRVHELMTSADSLIDWTEQILKECAVLTQGYYVS
jgi:hypothetical protein